MVWPVDKKKLGMARKINFGFMAAQETWPRKEMWISIGVKEYKHVMDPHNIRYVMIKTTERYHTHQLQERLNFIGVKVMGEIETYGHNFENSKHSSTIAKATTHESFKQTLFHWTHMTTSTVEKRNNRMRMLEEACAKLRQAYEVEFRRRMKYSKALKNVKKTMREISHVSDEVYQVCQGCLDDNRVSDDEL